MERVELSVVVPVYGCDECLHALHDRLTKSVASLVSSYEFVFVDDRSPDGSWETLREIAAADEHVRLVRLSRNFGQHPAITAGMAHATGEWIVVTDCDLEDPPEEIPRLYAKAQEGYDHGGLSLVSHQGPAGPNARVARRLKRCRCFADRNRRGSSWGGIRRTEG